MTTIVITRNSSYVLDDVKKTWERRATTPNSGHLRTESGLYDTITALEIGQPMKLLCPPIAAHAIARLIWTTDVQQIVRIWV